VGSGSLLLQKCIFQHLKSNLIGKASSGHASAALAASFRTPQYLGGASDGRGLEVVFAASFAALDAA